MSLPPELRVLCRILTSTPPARLPRSLPLAISHVLECRDALSSPHDQKIRDNASDVSVLVHKFKTIITTLIKGRTKQERLAAATLIKAVVEVGGWECLRIAEPWVQGLLSILQRNDPLGSKTVAITTLTKIYTLVHEYPTLIREISTPTLPAFATSCLNLLKTPSGGRPAIPVSMIESIFDSLSTLIPLYPTTCRPFASQIRSAIRPYLAPTSSDEFMVPSSLSESSRRLAIHLHYTAPKAGGSDEWAALVSRTVQHFHATADQTFRGIRESWESPPGYKAAKIDFAELPNGGGSSPDELPEWSGVFSGCQRLIGLLHTVQDTLRYPTKAAVTMPIGRLVDLVSRVAQITRSSPKSQTWEQALDTNPAVSREEKEELWCSMPELHVAALELLFTISQRLGSNFIPLVPEVLDQTTRILKSGVATSNVRCASYRLLSEILALCGPSMSKEMVAMFDLALSACCRDLQEHVGFSKEAPKPIQDTKKQTIATNVDLFLPTEVSSRTKARLLAPEHLTTAERLLYVSLNYAPQRHLKPALRAILDQTAIVTRNKDAMLASVLNPYKDKRDRMYPSILPFLSQQFPREQGLEILRSNIRLRNHVSNRTPGAAISDVEEEAEEADEEKIEEPPNNEAIDKKTEEAKDTIPPTNPSTSQPPIQTNTTPKENDSIPSAQDRPNPFSYIVRHESNGTAPNPTPAITVPIQGTKRSAETEVQSSPKRVALKPAVVQDVESDSDDESVHLNMELDDDEDEGEE